MNARTHPLRPAPDEGALRSPETRDSFQSSRGDSLLSSQTRDSFQSQLAKKTVPRRPGPAVRLASFVLPFVLAGCAGVPVEHYRAATPALDLRTYFNGTVDGWGMFRKRSGEVLKRFHVVIDARWQGDTGVLDERFTWSDGTTSRRVWTLTRQADGRYAGRADDVVGTASGEVAGNALRWTYVLALPVDGRTWHVDFDDWMFLIDERVMINRAAMSKWGFPLGEVTLAFQRR